MLRTKDQWQQYVLDNIDPNPNLGKRGYIAGDDLSKFYENSLTLLRQVSELVDLSGRKILDVGCSNGRLPIALDGEGVDIVSYTGFDVQKPPIDFCTKAFAESNKHRFIHVSIANTRYAPFQTGNLNNQELPIGDYDLLVANSVFTHLGQLSNADNYLGRLKNLMGDNSLLYVTWLKSPPNKSSNDTKRTVYNEKDIQNLYKKHDIAVLKHSGGMTTNYGDQWRILASWSK